MIYTVFVNCKLACAEPWAYLNDVLPQLARLEEGADVAHLLPAAWVARQKAATKTPLLEIDAA